MEIALKGFLSMSALEGKPRKKSDQEKFPFCFYSFPPPLKNFKKM
jgi:hypothetical protein